MEKIFDSAVYNRIYDALNTKGYIVTKLAHIKLPLLDSKLDKNVRVAQLIDGHYIYSVQDDADFHETVNSQNIQIRFCDAMYKADVPEMDIAWNKWNVVEYAFRDGNYVGSPVKLLEGATYNEALECLQQGYDHAKFTNGGTSWYDQLNNNLEGFAEVRFNGSVFVVCLENQANGLSAQSKQQLDEWCEISDQY